ncbi:hypothetical protein R6U79_13420 [Pseudomonas putida]|uniref:hypothetical protein n=1 Tax=Pseudomonas putida TaxID=303 RepID=UPI0029DE7D4B|nr:hypothetical protein [Pseudomonas putida]WPK03250.1 hypothetical protein R6U79_13420 [Pseudomonas putida]
MNAIDLNTHLAFQEIWSRINIDDEIQVVVLTGGRHQGFLFRCRHRYLLALSTREGGQGAGRW